MSLAIAIRLEVDLGTLQDDFGDVQNALDAMKRWLDRYSVKVSAGWPHADKLYLFSNEKDAQQFYESEYRNLKSFPDGSGEVSLCVNGKLVASREVFAEEVTIAETISK
jgi:hypothetical protein